MVTTDEEGRMSSAVPSPNITYGYSYPTPTPSKWKSRKLWLAITAILVAIAGALAGEITWTNAVYSITVAAAVYCGAEGYADGQGAGR